MKVLIIISRMNIGGPAKIITNQLISNSYPNINTLLVSGICEKNEKEYEGQNIESFPWVKIGSLKRSINLFWDLKSYLAITKLIKSYKPDLVHTHLSKAGLIGRLAASNSKNKPKIVHTYHGQIIDGYFKKWKVNLFIFLERLISKRTDAFFVVSNKTKEDLQNVKIGLDKPWHVVHPGVILRSEPLSFNSRANILWVGRFEEIKNPMLALESLLILRNKFKTNIKLTMIGNGSLHSKCVKYGKENNLNVDFPGWITDQEQIYLKSKFLLMTSVNEGLGLVAVEAGNFGLPTISTKSGGISDVVIDGKTGLLVESDSEQIAEAMNSLLADSEKLWQMSDQAFKNIQANFSIDKYLDSQIKVYKELVKNN